MIPHFDTMNETDVREVIVRPVLSRLGYAHGTQANIRTEVTLKYDRAFLGRKKGDRDPVLQGRADYVCEAVSWGRWVVEVKSPQVEITLDDIQQAHTYAAHPEIAAAFFLVTNGREFHLYTTGELHEPLLSWPFAETEQHMLTLFNILGYEALKRRAANMRPDTAKPLGVGLPSSVRIVGGHLTYGEHTSDHPLFRSDFVAGMSMAVTGDTVARTTEGLIMASVRIASPFSSWAKLNKSIGIETYEFGSADEFVSTDLEHPTIFQNVLNARVPPGVRIQPLPTMPEIALPVGYDMLAFTQVVGFVEGDCFRGTFDIDYQFMLIRGAPTGNPQIDTFFASLPLQASMSGSGVFDLRIA